MKIFKSSLAAVAATGAIALAPQGVYAAEGPYIGIGAGYNRNSDQTFDFAGERTGIAQPAEPLQLPLLENSGIAASTEYKDAPMYQFTLGYSFPSGLRPEFEVSYRRNDADSITGSNGRSLDDEGVKLTTTSGMLNMWYDLFPSWKLHPYLGGGVGATRFKLNKQPTDRISIGQSIPVPAVEVCAFQSCEGPRKSDDATFAYQLGAGARWDVTDSLTIGVDYRYLKSFNKAQFYNFKDQPETHLDSRYEAQTVLVSANYYFFKPAPPTPPAEPPVPVVIAPPPDTDGDGVIDEKDQCPATPQGEPVNEVGCPLPPPPPPCKVPVPGERVSLAGCGTGDVIVLHGVNFDFDRARLTPNAKVILDNVADELKAHTHIDVELSGHTDSKGSDEYNQRLSEERAASVVQYLVQNGVEGSRLTAVGYGESQPVATNDTEEGRELNRRVELKIVGGSTVGDTAEEAQAPVGPVNQEPSGVESAPSPPLEASEGGETFTPQVAK